MHILLLIVSHNIIADGTHQFTVVHKKQNFPLVEFCFSVGLILEPQEGWIVTSSMVTPLQTNRPKRALTSMCMEVTYKCRLLGLSLLHALAEFAHKQRSHVVWLLHIACSMISRHDSNSYIK